MTEPRVICLCLTADRPAMTDRAVRSFMDQTYEKKHLVILDTGRVTRYDPTHIMRRGCFVYVASHVRGPRETIGELRNRACHMAGGEPTTIYAHWDSDDWSAPTRLEQQVAELNPQHGIDGTRDAVGYTNLLFWDSLRRETWMYTQPENEVRAGSTLMYWRSTWLANPWNPTLNVGEDAEWIRRVKPLALESCSWGFTGEAPVPMMIAEIHGGNTSSRVQENSPQWSRAQQWDNRVRGIMEGA